MGKKSKNKEDFSTLLEMTTTSLEATAFLLIALFSCTALFSCKKPEANLQDHTELSQKIQDAQNDAVWAYEIESDRLSKRISSVSSIAKNIPLTPAAMIALEGGTPHPAVFPELAGFTNLNTTNLQGGVLDTINGFGNTLIEYISQAEAEAETEAEATKKDSSKIDAFFSPQTLYSLVLFLADSQEAGAFKSFIVGQPFINEEQIEVPIRFTCTNKILYTMVYPVLQGDAWKIQQIEIYKEEANDGKTNRN